MKKMLIRRLIFTFDLFIKVLLILLLAVADSADEKAWFNFPGFATEERVQGLSPMRQSRFGDGAPWGLIPFIWTEFYFMF